MHIPLHQFEQSINETILHRGLSYFKNGLVNDPEEITKGMFEAVVEGTQNYLVHLQIENGIITDHSCTCPYDYGPVCKHIVAVIFALQQEELEITPKQKKKRKTASGKPGKKTVAEKVDELLKELPAAFSFPFRSSEPERIKSFVCSAGKGDPAICRRTPWVYRLAGNGICGEICL